MTPDRASYRPGDVLAAVVEVRCRLMDGSSRAIVRADAHAACMLQVVTEPVAGAIQAATTHLEALQLELCALERVDLNWVSAKYRAGTTIIEKDNRRITRPLLKMKPVRLCEQTTLLPGSRRLYLVRSAPIVGLKQLFLTTTSPDQGDALLTWCVDGCIITPPLTSCKDSAARRAASFLQRFSHSVQLSA